MHKFLILKAHYLIKRRGCQNCNTSLIEAMWILSTRYSQIHCEEQLRSCGVQVNRQGQLSSSQIASNPKESVLIKIQVFNNNKTHLIHFKMVNGRSIMIVEASNSSLFLHCAPCNFKPVTPKLLSF